MYDIYKKTHPLNYAQNFKLNFCFLFVGGGTVGTVG